MVSVTISLPDRLGDHVRGRIDSGRYIDASDYVRDLIRRDQMGDAGDLFDIHDLDGSIVESLAEMQAGGGVDLAVACDALLQDLAAPNGLRPV